MVIDYLLTLDDLISQNMSSINSQFDKTIKQQPSGSTSATVEPEIKTWAVNADLINPWIDQVP